MSLAHDIHMALRPQSCGRHATESAYFSWLCKTQQRWRWFTVDCSEISSVPDEPVKIGVYRGEHSHKPRSREGVLINGRFATIVYTNHNEGEVKVRFYNPESYEVYELDLFETNSGRVPWRIQT